MRNSMPLAIAAMVMVALLDISSAGATDCPRQERLTREQYRACLDSGDVNWHFGTEEMTLLHRASERGRGTVQALLAAGADPNARDNLGRIPLHYTAGWSYHPELLEAQIEAGADVNAPDDDGRTPLHWAAAYSEAHYMVRILLDAGADATIRDAGGLTPADLIEQNRMLGRSGVAARLRSLAQ